MIENYLSNSFISINEVSAEIYKFYLDFVNWLPEYIIETEDHSGKKIVNVINLELPIKSVYPNLDYNTDNICIDFTINYGFWNTYFKNNSGAAYKFDIDRFKKIQIPYREVVEILYYQLLSKFVFHGIVTDKDGNHVTADYVLNKLKEIDMNKDFMSQLLDNIKTLITQIYDFYNYEEILRKVDKIMRYYGYGNIDYTNIRNLIDDGK